MILSLVCTRQVAGWVVRKLLIIHAGKLKGLFGDGSSAEDGSTSTVDSSVSSSPPKKTKTPAMPKDITVPLNVTVKFPSVAPMGLDQKREARQRYVYCCLYVYASSDTETLA
jgi:hypothetical protein